MDVEEEREDFDEEDAEGRKKRDIEAEEGEVRRGFGLFRSSPSRKGSAHPGDCGEIRRLRRVSIDILGVCPWSADEIGCGCRCA